MSIHSHTYFTVVIIIYNTGQYEISITLMQCLPIYVDVYANRKDIYIFKIILTIFYLSEILLLIVEVRKVPNNMKKNNGKYN